MQFSGRNSARGVSLTHAGRSKPYSTGVSREPPQFDNSPEDTGQITSMLICHKMNDEKRWPNVSVCCSCNCLRCLIFFLEFTLVSAGKEQASPQKKKTKCVSLLIISKIMNFKSTYTAEVED